MNLNHKTLYFRKKCFEIKVDVYEIVLFGMSDLDKVTVVYFYMLGLSCSGHCCSCEQCGPRASFLFEPSYCLGEQRGPWAACVNQAILVVVWVSKLIFYSFATFILIFLFVITSVLCQSH